MLEANLLKMEESVEIKDQYTQDKEIITDVSYFIIKSNKVCQ